MGLSVAWGKWNPNFTAVSEPFSINIMYCHSAVSPNPEIYKSYEYFVRIIWNMEFVILFCKQIALSRLSTIENQATYHNVVSTNMPWLEAHFRFYRLIVKNKFDVYLLWPFEKKLIFQSVALDFLRVCHRGIKLELLNIKVKKHSHQTTIG